MNALTPVKFDPSVPAYLQRPELMQLTSAAAGGISTFQRPHTISIKNSRFTFVDPEKRRTPSAEHNGVMLDVVVLDANPVLSKIYYAGGYDASPNAEQEAPPCFSDNGVGPSSNAITPQAPTCAVCPHAAWGSKVIETGAHLKACSDQKKLAVALASNPGGEVYLLAAPAASLKGWAALVAQLQQRGVPLGALVIRLGFDTTVSFPKLTYQPIGWVNQQQAEILAPLYGTPETQAIVGANDRPRAAVPQLATVAPIPAPQPLTPEPGYPIPPAQPVVAQPATVVNPAPPAAAAEVVRQRRGRRPAEPAPVQAAAPAPSAPPAPAAPAPLPPFMPVQSAPAAPLPGGMQAAGDDLNAMLDGIMAGRG